MRAMASWSFRRSEISRERRYQSSASAKRPVRIKVAKLTAGLRDPGLIAQFLKDPQSERQMGPSRVKPPRVQHKAT